MINKHYFVSRKGLSSLIKMKETLKNELYRATKEMGESVKRDNDLRENPEYMQLQTKISYELPSKIAELGRVDIGGGGTIAYILALYGMNVIDSGVPVLNMHAPWEATSKADIYETKCGYVAFLEKACL